jgi:hypothetical protein
MRFRRTQSACFALLFLLVVTLHAQEKLDLSPHTVQMVSVEKGVSFLASARLMIANLFRLLA